MPDDVPEDLLKHCGLKCVEELVTFTDVNPTNRHVFFTYTVRTLQDMIAERNLFQRQRRLLCDSWVDAWCLVLAYLPGKPPLFFNVTCKENKQGQWKIVSTPK